MTAFITGNTLIGWGHKPGPWFKRALELAEGMRADGADEKAIKSAVASMAPVEPDPVSLRPAGKAPLFGINIDPGDSESEQDNVRKVMDHMHELMRTPTIVAGAVMPDACPSGPIGTIPVGGVVATENAIHPGFHSSDICCSMAVSVFPEIDPVALLDAGMKISHFGGGGRTPSADMHPGDTLLEQFEQNRFLRTMGDAAVKHCGTQGDGNHFYYVGRLASTGQIALVTHHGSRKPGAMLYKAGMACAEEHRRKLCPELPKRNGWIPADTEEGEAYWEALQLIRAWTKKNHFAIHDAVARHLGLKIRERWWNEHNFVFRKDDGLFYHAKGATPAWTWFAPDSNGLTLIPLNMAEPILVARGRDCDSALGFAPHGAGRNFSRTQHMREREGVPEEKIVAEETKGIDARFYCGTPDISELPSAYKDAASVREQIDRYGLAQVVDTIDPLGCIMAGDWQRDAPWRRKRTSKGK